MTHPASPPHDRSPARGHLPPAALDDAGRIEPIDASDEGPLRLFGSPADAGCSRDPEYMNICSPGHPERICCDPVNCSFKGCAPDQGCRNRNGLKCFSRCTSAQDCEGDAAGGFSCQGGLCIPTLCTSNRDCDTGQVCSTSGFCDSPIATEPEPGCSSTGAGAAPSLLLAALTALVIAASRARRRRRPR